MPTQCYHDGDFWQCVTAVTNESPTQSPAKWRKIAIPVRFRTALVRLSVAIVLRSAREGQLDKSREIRRDGIAELDDLVQIEESQSSHRRRPRVRS